LPLLPVAKTNFISTACLYYLLNRCKGINFFRIFVAHNMPEPLCSRQR